MVGWHSISYFCRGGCLWDHILGLSLGWIWLLFWNMLLALCDSITFPRYILADWIWFLFWNNCAMFTFETFMFSPWITICINPARSLKAKHWIIFIHLLCWVYLEDIMGWLHSDIYWGMGSQHIFSYVSLIFFLKEWVKNCCTSYFMQGSMLWYIYLFLYVRYLCEILIQLSICYLGKDFKSSLKIFLENICYRKLLLIFGLMISGHSCMSSANSSPWSAWNFVGT